MYILARRDWSAAWETFAMKALSDALGRQGLTGLSLLRAHTRSPRMRWTVRLSAGFISGWQYEAEARVQRRRSSGHGRSRKLRTRGQFPGGDCFSCGRRWTVHRVCWHRWRNRTLMIGATPWVRQAGDRTEMDPSGWSCSSSGVPVSARSCPPWNPLHAQRTISSPPHVSGT